VAGVRERPSELPGLFSRAGLLVVAKGCVEVSETLGTGRDHAGWVFVESSGVTAVGKIGEASRAAFRDFTFGEVAFGDVAFGDVER